MSLITTTTITTATITINKYSNKKDTATKKTQQKTATKTNPLHIRPQRFLTTEKKTQQKQHN